MKWRKKMGGSFRAQKEKKTYRHPKRISRSIVKVNGTLKKGIMAKMVPKVKKNGSGRVKMGKFCYGNKHYGVDIIIYRCAKYQAQAE